MAFNVLFIEHVTETDNKEVTTPTLLEVETDATSLTCTMRIH